MVIYRITNPTNGKTYIGKTASSAEYRWKIHVRTARSNGSRVSQQAIHRAIRKYGAESFVVETLYHAKTEEELSKMETFFIILHQSHRSENGYNLTLGGDGVVPSDEKTRWKLGTGQRGKVRSKEHCARISAARKGQVSNRKGVTLSSETRQLIGRVQLGRIPWNKGKVGVQTAWNKGKPFGEVTRKNMSVSAKKRAESRSRNSEGRWVS